MARSSRAPISFEAATAAARARGAIQDRVAQSLPVDAIQPSPRNPRVRLDGINELAESLRAHGLLQPVIVRTVGDLASLASFKLDGHPYAPLAAAVEEVALGAFV